MLLNILLIFHTFLSAKKSIWGLCSLLGIRLLIPIFVRADYLNISFNTLALLILTFFTLIRFKDDIYNILTKSIEFKYIIHFILGLVLLTFFAVIPLSYQLKSLTQFFITELIPALLVLVIIRSKEDLKLVLYTLIFCSAINAVYGFITLFLGANPYFQYFILNYGGAAEFIYDFSDISNRAKGGLTNYAAGLTSGGPLIWSQLSLLLGLYFFCFPKTINKKVSTILALTLFANCFLTGQRSSFFAFTLVLCYLYISKINLKKIVISILLVITSFIILESFPQLQGIKKNIYSTFLFFDDSIAQKNNIGGSSMELRLMQTNATLETLSEYPIAGMGEGYPKFMSEKRGGIVDPIMAGYESIFFRVGWCSGITGLIIWTIFLCRIYKIIQIPIKQIKANRKAFWSGYIISCLATGIQSTFFMFLILVILFRKENQYMIYPELTKKRQEKNRKTQRVTNQLS